MDEASKTAVDNFADIVRRYCFWAENPLPDSVAEMQMARLLLAELHSVIFLSELETEDDKPEVEASDEWKNVFRRFGNLPVDGYWLIFDPIEAQENDTVYTTIADDLSDIYRDLKRGLQLFEAGYLADAAWEWKFGFKTHWGWHLLEAQKVVHFWFVNNEADL